MKNLIIPLVFLCGCFSPLNDIGHLLPKNQRPIIKERWPGHPEFGKIKKREYHQTIESIKKYYFTKEAYEAIKNIPAIDGIAYTPWVTGVNFWTNLLGILSLNGPGRQVIVSAKTLNNQGVYVFIHEYIHHLDDMDRDGDGEWIDHEEFRKAYKKMANDQDYMQIAPGRYLKIYNYPHIISEVEDKANFWVTDVFGIGEYAEHIAYVGHLLVKKGGPDYMWRVFRKILKRR